LGNVTGKLLRNLLGNFILPRFLSFCTADSITNTWAKLSFGLFSVFISQDTDSISLYPYYMTGSAYKLRGSVIYSSKERCIKADGE